MIARRTALSAVALTTTLVVPAVAQTPGPQVQVDRDCYLDTVVNGQRIATPISLSGNGFTPNSQFQISLDGQPLPGGAGTTDALGAVPSGTFRAPALSTLDRRQKTWKVRVDEGANTASTTFSTSDIFADFSPSTGTPSKLKVRFVANGFKLAQADTTKNPAVYIHYIRPNGKRKKSFRLGTATGPCGELKRTAKRRLFPFKAERGLWKLQVDTNKVYKRGKSDSTFTYYTMGVRIRTVFR